MRIVTIMRAAATITLGIAPLAYGQYWLLGHRLCRTNGDCGAVSTACWTPQHPLGNIYGYCTFCSGTSWGSYCEKAFDVDCPALDNNQACGERWAGTCTGTGKVGACVSWYPLNQNCSVPNCAWGSGTEPLPEP